MLLNARGPRINLLKHWVAQIMKKKETPQLQTALQI